MDCGTPRTCRRRCIRPRRRCNSVGSMIPSSTIHPFRSSRARSLGPRKSPGRAKLLEGASALEALSLSGRVGWELNDDESTAILNLAMQSPPKTAVEEVARIRAARQHAMSTGRTGDAYQPILDALAEVRDVRDPLCWDALVEEADLLIEKQRYTEGVTAAWEALELNPGWPSSGIDLDCCRPAPSISMARSGRPMPCGRWTSDIIWRI